MNLFPKNFTKPDLLVCIGPASKVTADIATKKLGKTYVLHFDSVDQAMHKVENFLKKDMLILVKGSRSVGLDKLVAHLLQP